MLASLAAPARGNYLSLSDLPSPLETEVQLTDWKSVATGAIVAGGGIASLAVAFAMGGFIGKIIEGVALSLIGLGSVAIYFEVALRRNVQREMVRLIGLERDLVASKVRYVRDDRDTNWKQILGARSNYRILLADPLQWINNYYYVVLDSAQENKIQIEILIPDPNGVFLEELADFLGRSTPNFRASIEEAAERIEVEWNSRKSVNKLISGSEISVKLMQRSPRYSVVVADRFAAAIMDGAIAKPDSGGPLVAVFEASRLDYPVRWFAAQFAEVGGLMGKFDGRVD